MSETLSVIIGTFAFLAPCSEMAGFGPGLELGCFETTVSYKETCIIVGDANFDHFQI